MSNARVSFEEYLKKQGVMAKCENTSAELRYTAGINYLFANEHDAKTFAKEFKIDRKIFKDSIQGNHAVFIDCEKYPSIIEQYKKAVSKQPPRLPEDIQKQITLLQDRQKILGDKKLSERINKIHELAANLTEGGWHSDQAQSALHLSLWNYLACNMDLMSPKEVKEVQAVSEYIMGSDGDVAKGRIKPDANWWDWVRKYEYKHTEESIAKSVINDALHLLDGVKNRRAITRETPAKVSGPMVVLPNEKVRTRDIPRFFPDEKGNSDCDDILISSGGMSTHDTVTKIWKKAVYADDKNIKPGERPLYYQYYQTEYNAGAGANRVEGKKNVLWTVSTKRILPKWSFTKKLTNDSSDMDGSDLKEMPHPISNAKDYNDAMRDTILDLIISHRMITLYRPATSSGIEGDPQHHSVTAEEKAAWTKWYIRIHSHLHYRIDPLSKMGVPQKSGNCTVMSTKVMFEDNIKGLAEEFWRFVKQYDLRGTQETLRLKKFELEKELKHSIAYYTVAREKYEDLCKRLSAVTGIPWLVKVEDKTIPPSASFYYEVKPPNQDDKIDEATKARLLLSKAINSLASDIKVEHKSDSKDNVFKQSINLCIPDDAFKKINSAALEKSYEALKNQNKNLESALIGEKSILERIIKDSKQPALPLRSEHNKFLVSLFPNQEHILQKEVINIIKQSIKDRIKKNLIMDEKKGEEAIQVLLKKFTNLFEAGRNKIIEDKSLEKQVNAFEKSLNSKQGVNELKKHTQVVDAFKIFLERIPEEYETSLRKMHLLFSQHLSGDKLDHHFNESVKEIKVLGDVNKLSKELEVPIDFLNNIQKHLKHVYKENYPEEKIKVDEFKRQFNELCGLIESALKVRIHYNDFKKDNVFFGKKPKVAFVGHLTDAEVEADQKQDGNIVFIRNIEARALSCLQGVNKSPLQIYQDLLATLNLEKSNAEARYKNKNKMTSSFGGISDLSKSINLALASQSKGSVAEATAKDSKSPKIS